MGSKSQASPLVTLTTNYSSFIINSKRFALMLRPSSVPLIQSIHHTLPSLLSKPFGSSSHEVSNIGALTGPDIYLRPSLNSSPQILTDFYSTLLKRLPTSTSPHNQLYATSVSAYHRLSWGLVFVNNTLNATSTILVVSVMVFPHFWTAKMNMATLTLAVFPHPPSPPSLVLTPLTPLVLPHGHISFPTTQPHPLPKL